MLYMDVGRWGGSGLTHDNTEQNWGYRRDFGLVCGETALLCEYRASAERKSPKPPHKDLQWALMCFQFDSPWLEINGELDEPTTKELRRVHDDFY